MIQDRLQFIQSELFSYAGLSCNILGLILIQFIVERF